MDLAGESMGGKPLGHCICIKKGPVDPVRGRAKHAMKANCASSHGAVSFHLLVGCKPIALYFSWRECLTKEANRTQHSRSSVRTRGYLGRSNTGLFGSVRICCRMGSGNPITRQRV